MISTVLSGSSEDWNTNTSVKSKRRSSPGNLSLSALKWFDMAISFRDDCEVGGGVDVLERRVSCAGSPAARLQLLNERSTSAASGMSCADSATSTQVNLASPVPSIGRKRHRALTGRTAVLFRRGDLPSRFWRPEQGRAQGPGARPSRLATAGALQSRHPKYGRTAPKLPVRQRKFLQQSP